jgi:hypothetical protein
MIDDVKSIVQRMPTPTYQKIQALLGPPDVSIPISFLEHTMRTSNEWSLIFTFDEVGGLKNVEVTPE